MISVKQIKKEIKIDLMKARPKNALHKKCQLAKNEAYFIGTKAKWSSDNIFWNKNYNHGVKQ